MLSRFRSGFLRDVTVTGSGLLAYQIIMFVAIPVITRLYSPEDFARFAFFMAIFSVFSVVVTGRYEIAIGLPKTRRDAIHLILVALILAMCSVAAIAISVGLFASLVDNSTLATFDSIIVYVCVALLLSALSLALTGWCIRDGHFGGLAKVRIGQALVTSGLTIGLGWWEFGARGLMLGYLVGQACRVVLLLTISPPLLPMLNSRRNLQRAWILAKRYRQFPLANAPAALFDSAGSQAPIFILSANFPANIVGYYDLTNRAVLAPLAMAAQAVAEVFNQRIAERSRGELPLRSLILRTSIVLFVLSAIPSLILYFWGEQIFAIVFGEAWSEAGRYAHILAVSYPFIISASVASRAFAFNGAIVTAAYWQVAHCFTLFTTLLLASQFGITSLLWALAMHEAISYAIYFWMAVQTSDRQKSSGPKTVNG